MSIEVGKEKGNDGKGARKKHLKGHQESGGFAKYYFKVNNQGGNRIKIQVCSSQ